MTRPGAPSPSMTGGAGKRPSAGPRAAFTLVEIILAIGLATVLLLLALTFYQQASELRGRILTEADRVSALRLLLDRISSDLRAAQPKAGPGNEFTGDSTSMSFVKQACLTLPPSAPQGTPEPADLARVSLTTLFGTNESRVVVNGMDRREWPLNAPVTTPALTAVPATTNLSAAASDPAFNPNPDSLTTDTPAQNNEVREPVIEQIRYVRFRYWNGTSWQAAWTNATPPPGVEIVLGTTSPAENTDSAAAAASSSSSAASVSVPVSVSVSASGAGEGTDTGGFPPDVMRRVVFIPGGAPTDTPLTADASSPVTP